MLIQSQLKHKALLQMIFQKKLAFVQRILNKFDSKPGLSLTWLAVMCNLFFWFLILQLFFIVLNRKMKILNINYRIQLDFLLHHRTCKYIKLQFLHLVNCIGYRSLFFAPSDACIGSLDHMRWMHQKKKRER